MAITNTNEKKNKLIKYAESIKQRLSASIPQKHANRVQAYKQMLEIDLKKTLSRIEKL
jgi:hypothetical protein